MRKEGIGIEIFFMYFLIQEKENNCVYIEGKERKKKEKTLRANFLRIFVASNVEIFHALT